MNLITKFLTIFVTLFIIKVETYRILGVFPLAFKSHNIFFMSLMNGLAKKGHQVDMISHYELKNPHKNYKTIINLANLNYSHPKTKFENIDEPIEIVADIVLLAKDVYGVQVCDLLAHETLQKFLRSPPKNPPYDVLITESLATNCFFGIGPLLNIPIVAVSACLDISSQSSIMGNPTSTAFYPSLFYKKFEIKTFWNRLENNLKSMYNAYRYLSFTDNQSGAMEKYLGPNAPTVREVEKMVSLLIANTYYSLQGIRPKIPAFVEVGGLHIEEDDSSLTPDLKQWMDESKDGVVLFSFGTLVPIETLPRKTLPSIFSAFAKLAPIRILVKTTDGYRFPFELPNNVGTLNWIPQIPVLKHPNTRVFISHGGIHSIMEAAYFGVPVIGTPLFYDQVQNIELLAAKNMCIHINYEEITGRSISRALRKILKNSKYRKAAKYQSQIFRDRQLKPLDTAAYWIEYVIKNGANSLRSPAADLQWWQLDQVDIYGFLLFSFALIIIAMIIIIKYVLKCCSKNESKSHLKSE